MKISGAAVLLIAALTVAQCPLGFTPEEACPADNPSCALYTDGNGDNLCDNPGPQPTEDDDDVSTDEGTVGDSLTIAPDTLEEVEEEDILPDTLSVADTSADTTSGQQIEQQELQEVFSGSPADEPDEEVSAEAAEEQESPLIGDRVIVLANEEGNLYCLDPRNESIAGHSCIVWEIQQRLTDSSTITEEVQIEVSEDSVYVDTITIESVTQPISNCPLGYTPEEACPEDDPSCALYTDANADLLCDNPGVPTDTASTLSFDVTSRAYGLIPVASGCPLGLPPEAACPSPDNRMCAHYMGWSGCRNPSGGGMARTLLILVTTAVLLVTSTVLKRHLCGLGRAQRKKRKVAHITVQLVSLVVLGFLVQGCYCPIGLVQYALLPVGLIFLGILGIAVLILPMIWSAFFDRVFCGWVCPFGALQDLLGKLHVPRPPKFPHKVHMLMSGFRYLLALLFFGFIVLASSGYFPGLAPEAFFCNIDPFHTIFSFFVVGSLTVAIIAICVLIFFPRFFCKYLCFYGAILSFLGRIGLWNRIVHKKLPKSCEDEETEDLEFPPH